MARIQVTATVLRPTAGTEVVVLDPAVEHADVLVDRLRPGVELLRLTTAGDGLQQIATALAGRRDLTALHLVCHGGPGRLVLAGESVDLPALSARPDTLQALAGALARDATVLVYGCSVAAGAAGRLFLDYLEAALGVTVAASPTPVGAAARGGRWSLIRDHRPAAPIAFAPSVREAFPGLLAAASLTTGADTPVLSTGADTVTAGIAGSLNAGDAIDGLAGSDTLVISTAQTVTFGAATLLNVETVTITAGTQAITTSDATVASGQTLTVDASASADAVAWTGSAETDGRFAITGGTGADTLIGGAGADTLSGGGGGDRLSGGAGNDVLVFGCACDAQGATIDGGSGTDTITLASNASVDFSVAGSIAGIEAVSAQSGATAVFVDQFGGQALTLSGTGSFGFAVSTATTYDASAFVTSGLTAGTSTVQIYGDQLNDDAETIVGTATFGAVINAAGGDDDVSGGSGADTISGGDGSDYLSGLAGNDVLEGNLGSDLLTGGDGNDVLSGGWDDDYLLGGAGADTLSGGDAADYLCGEAGNDVLSGGVGDDTLCGDIGNDALSGGAGSDALVGGDGADTLVGGGGADTLSGGDGSDLFVGSDGATLVDWAAGEVLQVTSTTLTAAGIVRTGDALAIDTDGDSTADLTVTATGLSGSAQFAVTLSGGVARITYSIPSDDSGGGDDGSSAPADPVVVTDTPAAGTAGAVRTIANTGSTSGSAAIVENTGNNGNLVTATLPAGVTITAEGPAAAQAGTDAAGTLVGAVDARDSTGELSLLDGARNFLAGLADGTTLDIRTIVPTTDAAELAEPIVLTGSSGGSQSEAFVIDVRGLPTGSTVQLDNIEFASIIGNATVTGGTGDNYAAGDDSAQFISLGEGDDTLYGGGGDDTVGSAGGADRLFGDAGDDSVFGGAGADSVYGGDDQDVLYGNQAADVLYGNPGLDTLYGGQDGDVAYGGQHEDLLYGNLGDDVLYGNLGGDTLFGGQGDDILYGGSNDGSALVAGAPDVLYGNLGDDTLVGGQGGDILYGGDGSDLFVFGAGAGDDTIADFDGAAGDRVEVLADTGIETLSQLIDTIGTAADGSVQFEIGGNYLVLSGVTVDELQSGWFGFG